MADIMVTFAHDFATKWEMEAFARQDMKGFEGGDWDEKASPTTLMSLT